MRAADTNLLVRLLTRDDIRAVAKAEEFVSGGAWVSHLVLAETMWVLDAVYARSAKQIAAAVEALLKHVSLTMQDADVVEKALADFISHPRLSFSDCLIVAIARKAGHVPVGTFDRHLAKLEHVVALR